jgi:soluble lytic murein transglycosylase
MTALKTSKFFKQVDFNYEQTLDPAYNILLGSGYLSFLLKYYQGSVLSSVAAYNAGPKAVNMWIRACSTCGPAEFVDFIPFNETRWYVKKVIKSYYKFSQIFNSKFDHRVVFHMPSELRDDVVIF